VGLKFFSKNGSNPLAVFLLGNDEAVSHLVGGGDGGEHATGFQLVDDTNGYDIVADIDELNATKDRFRGSRTKDAFLE
jgi:hypothetical protein